MINVDFIDSSEVTTERIYQWDIGRKLKISNTGSAIAPVVHFCNKKSEKALAVESILSGDFYIADIPNGLLQEEYDIIAYIYVGSEEEAKTIKVAHIPVTKRLKPETYVATEDENVIDFLTISAEMKSLLDGLVITEYDSTKSYIKPNIVYYKGSSYICKSETTITNVLPTDTTKWGLMCESGANVSQITFSNDTLYFKLQDNTMVDVPLGSVAVSVVEIEPVAFSITKDENDVLKFNNGVIEYKTLLYDNEDGAKTVGLSEFGIQAGDTLEVVLAISQNPKQSSTYNDYVIKRYVVKEADVLYAHTYVTTQRSIGAVSGHYITYDTGVISVGTSQVQLVDDNSLTVFIIKTSSADTTEYYNSTSQKITKVYKVITKDIEFSADTGEGNDGTDNFNPDGIL